MIAYNSHIQHGNQKNTLWEGGGKGGQVRVSRCALSLRTQPAAVVTVAYLMGLSAPNQ